MPMDRLFDNTISLLEKVLDFASLRHGILAGNIANLNTPGYKARDLLFKEELQGAIRAMEKPEIREASWSGNSIDGHKSLENLSPRLIFQKTLRVSEDGNTVDIDHEMSKLAENNLFYDVAVQLIAKKLNILKSSIT